MISILLIHVSAVSLLSELPRVAALQRKVSKSDLPPVGMKDAPVVTLNSIVTKLRTMSRDDQIKLHVAYLSECRIAATGLVRKPRGAPSNWRSVAYVHWREFDAGKLDVLNIVNDRPLLFYPESHFRGVQFDSRSFSFRRRANEGPLSDCSKVMGGPPISLLARIDIALPLAREGYFVI